MDDIGAVNHAIGGVDVEIETDMTSIDPAFKKGETVRLSDKQAVKYIRARTGLEDETNAARMRRQQQYMQKVYNLIMNQIRENPEYLSDIYQELEGKIQTEGEAHNLSQIANKMVQYESVGIMQLSGTTKIADTQGDGKEHEEFYVSEDSINKCLGKIIEIKKAPADYYEKQAATEETKNHEGTEIDDDENGADPNDTSDDSGTASGMGDPDKIKIVE